MHDEFDMAIMPQPTITISSKELPEVKKWQNSSRYNIRKVFKNARQIRKTETEDGTVFVELAVDIDDPKTEGELTE